MIKIENVTTAGWEPALRGMRNPMNSWDKADSVDCSGYYANGDTCYSWETGLPCPYQSDEFECEVCREQDYESQIGIGSSDHGLAMKLRNAGTDHRKFMRMIVCYADITAPLYWWKEFDTYRNGVEKNSCSTMHKIAEHRFTREDFSCENLRNEKFGHFMNSLDSTIACLNVARDMYLKAGKSKDDWWQMIQLLPSSYNQKRTVMMSYEALANMYHARNGHKLDEWREFCKRVETLPYSELITGGKENA